MSYHLQYTATTIKKITEGTAERSHSEYEVSLGGLNYFINN